MKKTMILQLIAGALTVASWIIDYKSNDAYYEELRQDVKDDVLKELHK